MSQKLRLAVLIDNNSVKKYASTIIDKIANIPDCEIVATINYVSSERRNKGILYATYEFIDRLVYARGTNYIKSCSVDIEGVKRIDIGTEYRNAGLYLNDADLVKIKNENLDLILKFSSDNFKGDILDTAKYGIWEYRYGRSRTSSDFAAIYETLNGEKTQQASLVKLHTETEGGYTIEHFLASSDMLSLFNNQNQLCWKTHMMMVRNVERLVHDPEKFVSEKSHNITFHKDVLESYPDNIEMIKPLFSLLYKNIASRMDRLFYKAQWSIYYAENEKGKLYQRDLSKFIKIDTPNHLFWADPFVIDKDKKSYIFFEDYVYKTKKGHISVIEYDHTSKQTSRPYTVVDTSYHQSYPFIMAYEGEIYMIPEGSKDRDVKLYKATDFPHKWEVTRTFFQGKEAVDMTLFQFDGKWWLFANMIDEPGQSLNEELHIFYCDDFRKDVWIPHTKNPVICSVQTSRPAGKIISYKGDFYRPSQNSVGSYGYGTNFNRIITLTPDEYKEEFVEEITPDFIKNARAIHTYNSSDRLTVIDVVHKIRRFFNP